MRQILIRVIFGAVLGVGLLTAFAAYGQTSLSSSKYPTYVNRSYDFQVVLPPGLTYTHTVPPSPDHGIGIDLNDQTKIWLDASYTDSSTTDEEAGTVSADCKVKQRRRALLGSMPALVIRFSCAANGTEKPYEEQLILSIHRSAHRAPICYEIGIRATNARISAQAEDLFTKLVAGFSRPK
jgi:hypothetical protein